MNFDFKCPFTPEQLEEVQQKRLLAIDDWISKRYPKLRLETLERFLPYFEEIKKYDDACKNCMSTQMCPTLDGNRMQGELMPDGYLRVWMMPCPQGYKVPRCREEQQEQSSGWRKRQ